MSKKIKHLVGIQLQSKKALDDYRNLIVEEFESESCIRKQKITQGAYWTFLDKDLACQYLRDERWFFGIKILDEIKFIDHGVEEVNGNKNIGFKK